MATSSALDQLKVSNISTSHLEYSACESSEQGPHYLSLLGPEQVNRTPLFDTSIPLRAVYLEYSPTTEKHSRSRPFRHCRIVITRDGDHQNGEPLNESSTGYVYDRIGAMSRNGKKDKELGIVLEQETYEGLPKGHWSVYCGFTRYSPDDIQSYVNAKVQSDISNGVKYNLFTYNCQDFARLIVSVISVESVVGLRIYADMDYPPAMIPVVGVLDPSDGDAFTIETSRYMTISQAYGHYKVQ